MNSIYLLAALAMSAFAANSVLCRLALGTDAIDAKSFTTIRLVSGAIILWLLAASRGACLWPLRIGDPVSAAALFFYAAGFSFAYQTLTTGTGAIILFGSVQVTMIAHSIFIGNFPSLLEWLGLVTSLGGFVYLMLPGISTPGLSGSILMALAGISWAVYTLRGRNNTNPLASTTGNFILATPFTALLFLIGDGDIQLSSTGVVLAALSGTLASAMGYAIWYIVLPRLSVSEAAVVQLSVPGLAALGGILFMSEVFTLRFGISSSLILGGILAVVVGRQKKKSHVP